MGGPVREIAPERRPGSAVGLFFFFAPTALVLLAVALRSAGLVDDEATVRARLVPHLDAARAAAEAEGLDLPLVLAVASVESGGRADARSRAGAVGLMQLMPGTAEETAEALRIEGPLRLEDPAVSLRLGAAYLRRMRDRFAAEPCAAELSLAAYNAGPGRVREWLDAAPPPDCASVGDWIPYRETQGFVRRVREWEGRWAAWLGAPSTPRETR